MIQIANEAPGATSQVVSASVHETALMADFQDERTTAAFEALYRAASPLLLEWIRQFAGTRRFAVDPSDALQDTFVNIYRYAGSFRRTAPGGFRAWARTIAGNVIRRARSRPASQGVLFADIGGAPTNAADDRQKSPAAQAIDVEDSRALTKGYLVLLAHFARALSTLKERDRRALEMVEVQGLTYAEVGRRLGAGPSNTKMIVFRARKRLYAAITQSLAANGFVSAGADSAAA